jgi:hypothetical protein
MAKRKTKADELPEHWADYRAIQLTDKEKAAARAELQQEIERMRREGVYENLLAFRGKVDLHLTVEEIRKLRKDRR